MSTQKKRNIGRSFDQQAVSHPDGWKFRIIKSGKSFVADKTAKEDPIKVVKEVNGVVVDTFDLGRLRMMRDKILARMRNEEQGEK